MKFKTAEEMYNELINNKDEEIFIKWKEALDEKRKLNLISIIICIFLDILILYIIHTHNFTTNLFKMQFIVPILILDIVICIFIPAFGKKQKEYKKVFKEIIIKRILCNFYDSLEYFPQKQMPKRIYDEHLYEEYDDYYSEDYIEAKIDNTYNISMAEVETEEEEVYTDSDGTKHTETTTVFHGLFAKIDMNKSINCDLDIKVNNNFNLSILKANKLEMDSRRI